VTIVAEAIAKSRERFSFTNPIADEGGGGMKDVDHVSLRCGNYIARVLWLICNL
jgi:hypothetical protein